MYFRLVVIHVLKHSDDFVVSAAVLRDCYTCCEVCVRLVNIVVRAAYLSLIVVNQYALILHFNKLNSNHMLLPW